MAAFLALAIAADGDVGLLRQCREQVNEPLGARIAHLAVVVTRVFSPACLRPRLGERPAHPLLARRELRQPQVIEAAARIVGFAHAAGRTTHDADAQTFAGLSCRPEPYYAERQAVFCALTTYCAPRNGAIGSREIGASARLRASNARSCSSFSGKKMKLHAWLSSLRMPRLAS